MSSIETVIDNNNGIATPQETSAPVFFPVSVTKLLVLSLCTSGLYELYWLYKNWQIIKQREQSDIIPFWRAFFAVFFCHALLSQIRSEAESSGTGSFPAGPLAAGWIITTLLWRLPDPYWLVTFLAVCFLLPVQHVVNRLNSVRAPGHDANTRFTAINIVTVVGGGILFGMAVIGTFIPDEPV